MQFAFRFQKDFVAYSVVFSVGNRPKWLFVCYRLQTPDLGLAYCDQFD